MADPFETPGETLKERIDVLKSGQLSDCVFIVGDKEERIVAHKIFLAVSSPVFYKMFYGVTAEKTDTVRIKDIEQIGFTGMLQYIYTDKVDFKSHRCACMVYSAAKKYLMPYLEKQCVLYIKKNINVLTVCELFELAKFHDISSIRLSCMNLIMAKTEEVLSCQSFIDSDYETILMIVKMDRLNISSELLLFKAVEKWACNQSKTRGITIEVLSSKLRAIICQLRFLSLTAKEFTELRVKISHYLMPLLTTEEQLAILMNIVNPRSKPLPSHILSIKSRRSYSSSDNEDTVTFPSRHLTRKTKKFGRVSEVNMKLRLQSFETGKDCYCNKKYFDESH